MSKKIDIPNSLYERLGTHARAFETPAEVIARMLNAYEGVDDTPSQASKQIADTDKDNTEVAAAKKSNKKSSKKINEKARNKMTPDSIRQVCELAADVYDGKLKAAEARDLLVKNAGMNANSALTLVHIFKYMVEGRAQQFAASAPVIYYFLKYIRKHYGDEASADALRAARESIEKKGGAQRKMRKVCDEFEAELQQPEQPA